MNDAARVTALLADREVLISALYEAAELEHNLMCTYLYAAFSLKSGEADGLNPEQAAAVARWRRTLLNVAVEEMGHLAAVWNITAALGASPRFGRTNFPLDPGYLPASIVVKLAPFCPETLQHFVFLERPSGSHEPEGAGFKPERQYVRGNEVACLTPMGINYDTVGDFYQALSDGLKALAARLGEAVAFSGDSALQLSPAELNLNGAQPVLCLKTALAAFDAIVLQGEGAPQASIGSHFAKFIAIRDELRNLQAKDPAFNPALPVAINPVLRRPPRPEGRVWIESPDAVATVDLGNATYGLMLRLLAYGYLLRGPSTEKALAIDLALGLMRALTPLAERAARLPAGPANPGVNAGISFTALRDAAPCPPGIAARRLFTERLATLAAAADRLRATSNDPRVSSAAEQLEGLSRRASRGFESAATRDAASDTASDAAATARTIAPTEPSVTAAGSIEPAPYSSGLVNGVETAQGQKLDLIFEAKRCIHSRFCVTGAPKVFLANVEGPWIHPDAMEAASVVEIAHACPSGAIRYRRKDGVHDEQAPPVNLVSIREAGPYAFRGQLEIDGTPCGFRATLCRCGASNNKPFCDGSHHTAGFTATGEPPTGKADMLPVRDGVLGIAPQANGPLAVRGNAEIISGTGRVVARTTATYLCRCGGSANKPFCDGTHAKIGFKAP